MILVKEQVDQVITAGWMRLAAIESHLAIKEDVILDDRDLDVERMYSLEIQMYNVHLAMYNSKTESRADKRDIETIYLGMLSLLQKTERYEK